MTWSFPVGRLFGSETRIHATFFLLLWIGVAAFLEGGLPAAISSIVFIAASSEISDVVMRNLARSRRDDRQL